MKIKLKILEVNDVTKEYVGWFSDKDVIKFSQNQYRKFTLSGQKKYVKECLKNKNIKLYGIFYKKKHIGNMCLTGLISPNKSSEITYVVGDKSLWGKGVASQAISKIISIAKKKYKLNKLFAGVADKNLASKKVFEKNNFKLEGIRKKHLFINNKFYNQLDYGLLLK